MHLDGGTRPRRHPRAVRRAPSRRCSGARSTAPTSGPSAPTAGAWAGPCTTGTASPATATTAPPIGQYAYLRVVPHGGRGRRAADQRRRRPPAVRRPVPGTARRAGRGAHARRLRPAGRAARGGHRPRWLGTYRREGVVITVTQDDDGGAHLRYEFVDGMKDLSPPLEVDLVPVTETVFAASGVGPLQRGPLPVVFSTLTNGTRCVLRRHARHPQDHVIQSSDGSRSNRTVRPRASDDVVLGPGDPPPSGGRCYSHSAVSRTWATFMPPLRRA